MICSRFWLMPRHSPYSTLTTRQLRTMVTLRMTRFCSPTFSTSPSKSRFRSASLTPCPISSVLSLAWKHSLSSLSSSSSAPPLPNFIFLTDYVTCFSFRTLTAKIREEKGRSLVRPLAQVWRSKYGSASLGCAASQRRRSAGKSLLSLGRANWNTL